MPRSRQVDWLGCRLRQRSQPPTRQVAAGVLAGCFPARVAGVQGYPLKVCSFAPKSRTLLPVFYEGYEVCSLDRCGRPVEEGRVRVRAWRGGGVRCSRLAILREKFSVHLARKKRWRLFSQGEVRIVYLIELSKRHRNLCLSFGSSTAARRAPVYDIKVLAHTTGLEESGEVITSASVTLLFRC